MTYQELLNIDDITQFDEKNQLEIIGNLFDTSFDNQNISGIEKAFDHLKSIDIENFSDENKTIIYYDISNGWSYLRKLRYHNTSQAWNFQMEELTNEILFQRKAIISDGFSKIQKERQCQIYTNLGNSLSFIGRFVEAQSYWNKAIQIIPNFAMAIANKANGLFYYGHILFVEQHKLIFYNHSYHYLKEALEYKQYLEGGAEVFFTELKEQIENRFTDEFLSVKFDLSDFDLGNDPNLRNYRNWCLTNKLFINPLNDLGQYTNASHDCMNLSTIIIQAKKPPTYFTLYNQIKQEFSTARFSFYQSTKNANFHYSDEDVVILDTMETALYSYNIEQTKIAYRISYSILDKISYLLNDYLKLNIPLHLVNFKSIWHLNKSKTLKPIFQNSDNWALRGLYWLSKDIYEKDFDYDKIMEPDAMELSIIRNHLEHKCLKILGSKELYETLYNTSDDISYTIERTEFEAKTMKLLNLVRASIIYLSIAIDHEEKKKDRDDLKTLPIQLTKIAKHEKI
ncbi:MAG: hypothetical protein JNL95_09740 [Chitinophagales bacterium]|nr:hypothetical protein [Chitinophagales bacterium]